MAQDRGFFLENNTSTFVSLYGLSAMSVKVGPLTFTHTSKTKNEFHTKYMQAVAQLFNTSPFFLQIHV